MTVIADFNFEDGHELNDYKLEISQDFPLNAEIENNTLMLESNPHVGGELIIHIEGKWAKATPVSILLRNAQGKVRLSGGTTIDSPLPEDKKVQAEISPSPIDDGSYMILFVLFGDRFQFTGYEIETNSLI